MAQQKIKINLPALYSKEDRIAIADEIIKKIVDRTRNERKGFNAATGKQIDLTKAKYSKAYAKKKGVSVSDVDLTLSSEMLDAIIALKQTPRSITVGFEAGSTANDKAEGNQKGTYGKKSPIPGKARPFLGLLKKDLDSILENYDPKSD